MIKILVDSSSDFRFEDAHKLNMEFVPITISLNGKDYLDGINLDRNEFYELIRTTPDFPKTSQPSPHEFERYFKEAKNNNDEIICILLSSELSGTCQSANLARNMVGYDKIHIIDSLSATVPIGVMVNYALKLVEDGFTATEIVSKINEIKSKIKLIACVDTLEYLFKGGRLSRTSAIVGEIANIKPIITLTNEGTVEVIGKCIGRIKALNQITKSVSLDSINSDFPIHTIYTYGTENCEKLEEKLEKEGIIPTSRLQVGPTIGAHIGAGAFGIVYVEA